MPFESILLQTASLRNEFIIFSIIISFPSMILYVAEMFTILWHKKFHNSFYILILFRSILNLIYTLDSYLYRLQILIGHLLLPLFLLLPNWTLCLIFFLSDCTMFGDYLATFFILLNRWTAIKMPVRHKRIWRKLLPISLLIIILIPICLSVDDFNAKASIQMDNFTGDNTTGSFFIGTDSDFSQEFPFGVIFSCGFLAISICLNASTIMAYRKHRVQVGTRNLAEINRQNVEQRLLAYAFLTFIGHALMASIQILLFVVKDTANMAFLSAIYTQYPWTMDLGSVVLPSWLLFWASEEFRRHLIATFIPKWIQKCWKSLRKKIVSVKTTKTIPINLADCQTTQVQTKSLDNIPVNEIFKGYNKKETNGII